MDLPITLKLKDLKLKSISVNGKHYLNKIFSLKFGNYRILKKKNMGSGAARCGCLTVTQKIQDGSNPFGPADL